MYAKARGNVDVQYTTSANVPAAHAQFEYLQLNPYRNGGLEFVLSRKPLEALRSFKG